MHSVIVAITLTLKPIHFKLRLDAQYNMLRSALHDLQHKAEFSLICELTKSYNIHLHGFARIKKPNQWSVSRQLHELFRNHPVIGFICVKPLDDSGKWLDYCVKNREQTKLEDVHFVLCDDLEYFQDYLINILTYEKTY